VFRRRKTEVLSGAPGHFKQKPDFCSRLKNEKIKRNPAHLFEGGKRGETKLGAMYGYDAPNAGSQWGRSLLFASHHRYVNSERRCQSNWV
jgi:hypothetical protein